MKRIEFSGIPGSGKSTILPVVAQFLEHQGQDVVDVDSLILRSNRLPFRSRWFRRAITILPTRLRQKLTRALNNYFYLNYEYQLKYMSEHLPLLQPLIEFVNARPIPKVHKEMLIRWFVKMAGSYQMAREVLSEDSVYLLDEGYVQKVISLYISVEEDMPDSVAIRSYLDQIPQDMTLIHVTADPETCKRRILQRSLPRRLQGNEECDIEDYLTKSRKAIEFAAGYISRRGGRVVVVDNSQEPFTRTSIEEQLSNSLVVA